MITAQQVQDIAIAGSAALGALSVLCTALSHIPLPKRLARVSEFFARVGMATAKFSVNKRSAPDPADDANSAR